MSGLAMYELWAAQSSSAPCNGVQKGLLRGKEGVLVVEAGLRGAGKGKGTN